MINYIDYYFEAKKPLTDEDKIKLFFNASGSLGGLWKKVESDFSAVMKKKSGATQQKIKDRLDFFQKLYFKLQKENPNNYTEIRKEIILYVDSKTPKGLNALKNFLSHPFLAYYYDSLKKEFSASLSNTKKAPYIGFFKETSSIDKSDYSSEVKKFIKNIYDQIQTTEIAATIKELKENSLSLPNQKVIENDKSAQKIISELIHYLSMKDYDWTTLLMDFVYIYDAQKNNKKLEVDGIEISNTNISEYIQLQNQGIATQQKSISAQNVRGVRANKKIESKGFIADRKRKKIEAGLLSPTEKFKKEQEEKLREEKKERENKYITNWKKYGDALLDDIYPRQNIKEYWNEILGSDEYQEMVTKLQKEISDPDILKKVLDEIEKDIKSGFREKSEELKKNIQDLANLSIKEKRKTLRTIDPSGTLDRSIEKLTATKSQQAMRIAYGNPKGDTLATYQTTIKQMKTGSDFLTQEQMPKMIAWMQKIYPTLSATNKTLWLEGLKQLLENKFNNKIELKNAIIDLYENLKKQTVEISDPLSDFNRENRSVYVAKESVNSLINSVLKRHKLQ